MSAVGLQVGQGTCQGVTYGGDFPTISANYKWLHSVFRPRAPQIRCSRLQAAQRAPSVLEEAGGAKKVLFSSKY